MPQITPVPTASIGVSSEPLDKFGLLTETDLKKNGFHLLGYGSMVVMYPSMGMQTQSAVMMVRREEWCLGIPEDGDSFDNQTIYRVAYYERFLPDAAREDILKSIHKFYRIESNQTESHTVGVCTAFRGVGKWISDQTQRMIRPGAHIPIVDDRGGKEGQNYGTTYRKIEEMTSLDALHGWLEQHRVKQSDKLSDEKSEILIDQMNRMDWAAEGRVATEDGEDEDLVHALRIGIAVAEREIHNKYRPTYGKRRRIW